MRETVLILARITGCTLKRDADGNDDNDVFIERRAANCSDYLLEC
jgi:hypothetical protein